MATNIGLAPEDRSGDSGQNSGRSFEEVPLDQQHSPYNSTAATANGLPTPLDHYATQAAIEAPHSQSTPAHMPGSDADSSASSYESNPFVDGAPFAPQPTVPWNQDCLFLNRYPVEEASSSRSTGSSIAYGYRMGPLRNDEKWFRSRRIRRGEPVERPWLDKPDPRAKWMVIIPLIGLMVGLMLAGFLIWDGVRSVDNFRYCSVLDEDFSHGLRDDIWTREVEVGGYG